MEKPTRNRRPRTRGREALGTGSGYDGDGRGVHRGVVAAAEIHQQIRWSPWAMQDRAGEYDAALKVCGQWTSTEPESPGKTLEEYEAELEQIDAQFLAAEAQGEKAGVG